MFAQTDGGIVDHSLEATVVPHSHGCRDVTDESKTRPRATPSVRILAGWARWHARLQTDPKDRAMLEARTTPSSTKNRHAEIQLYQSPPGGVDEKGAQRKWIDGDGDGVGDGVGDGDSIASRLFVVVLGLCCFLFYQPGFKNLPVDWGPCKIVAWRRSSLSP